MRTDDSIHDPRKPAQDLADRETQEEREDYIFDLRRYYPEGCADTEQPDEFLPRGDAAA